MTPPSVRSADFVGDFGASLVTKPSKLLSINVSNKTEPLTRCFILIPLKRVFEKLEPGS